ncbi:MAG: hypothetical protein QXI58_00885 [Candidatus Micrarchaeia archaeon]
MIKRLFLPIILLIITVFILSLLETETFLIFLRKIFYLSTIIILVHLIRKAVFPYIDIRKEYLEAQSKDPAKAFLGISFIIGLFIFGILVCFALLL